MNPLHTSLLQTGTKDTRKETELISNNENPILEKQRRSISNVETRKSISFDDADVLLDISRSSQSRFTHLKQRESLFESASMRTSMSIIPSIFSHKDNNHNEPMIDAADALERIGGKGPRGAYSEHLMSLIELAAMYSCHVDETDPNKSKGLTEQSAEQLLVQYGPNTLTPPPKVPLWLLFLIQFTNLLMVLLLMTATMCLILFFIDVSDLTNLYIAVLLYVVVVLTCYETFSQEAKSDSLMEKFRAMVPETASVTRGGVLKAISATDLVIGDIIRLKSGDKIPADCRVIYNQGMKVDQSMITGESEAIDVSVTAMDNNSLEARNIIFNGSLVVDGGCIAIVIRSGDNSLIGTMVQLTGDVGKSSSTLKADIEYFVKVLTIFALFQAAIVFIVGLARGLDPVQVFVQGFVVIMIGNVPQGLPTTVTACLFIVAESMGKQNVFVKKLDVIETLGSCTLICTDKTGTLTLNVMSVANMWFFDRKSSQDEFSAAASAARGDKANHQLFALLNVAVLNSRVVLEKKTEDSEAIPTGDATELGFYRFFSICVKECFQMDIETFREKNVKVHEIPFNSSFKWQMSIHNITAPDSDAVVKQVLFLKGAPDVLMSKCSFYLNQRGEVVPIDAEFMVSYQRAYEDFGGEGERVLGFAMRDMPRSMDEELSLEPKFKEKLKEDLIGVQKTSSPIKDLVFVGLITLQDPPRKEVPQAIKDCHTAGVKVVMVTGDHPLTAAAIARKIGLITLPTKESLAKDRGVPVDQIPPHDAQAVVVHGSEIPSMTEDDWKMLVSKKEIVFARTSPEQKLTIVKEFTKAGNVTAMTGDGVNDSPFIAKYAFNICDDPIQALKQAAIGVAMGLNGSDVAREAADLVLLDDNFASIVVGIKEGRLLFANLKKSIAYTLAHLVPEVVPVLLWAFVGIPQPMGSILTLCIDLLTELAPATSLAFERAESLIMQVPPRDVKKDKLTSFPLLFYSYGQAGLILTGACLFTYFQVFNFYGVSAKDLFTNNNQYFPSANGDSFTTSSGLSYDSSTQNHILSVIQGTWFLAIVCCQASHIWVCRTTTVSIFEHGVFGNNHTTVGVAIALVLGCFVVYTPGLQMIVGAANPFSLVLLEASLICAFSLWTYSEGRKYFTRSYPNHWLNKYLAW